jgi:hypothetical protein
MGKGSRGNRHAQRRGRGRIKETGRKGKYGKMKKEVRERQ